MMEIRKSDDRGKGNFGWLEARYSFSFSNYYHPKFNGFGDLLVINEDRIAPSRGFGIHPHMDMEIITYVIEGALKHEDSMGNSGVVRRGEIQYLSAGTGITHSEHNHLDDKPTHLLQIWIRPNQERCHPNYGQASYAERLIPNQLCLIVSGNGREQSVKVNQDVSLFTARVAPGKTIPYQLPIHRKAWIQVVSGQINVNRSLLDSGDGLAIAEVENLSITANSASEFLLFDLR